jgi:hypothetical protein
VCEDNVVSGLPLVTDCEACGLAKLGQHAELLQDSFLKDKQFKFNTYFCTVKIQHNEFSTVQELHY